MTTRILVAEDNPATADLIQFVLEAAGFEVSVARNGRVALDLARVDPFDCYVADYQMPGLNGEQLCQEVRNLQTKNSVPFLLCSGKKLELDLEHLKTVTGITEVVRKPFSPAKLATRIQAILAEHVASGVAEIGASEHDLVRAAG